MRYGLLTTHRIASGNRACIVDPGDQQCRLIRDDIEGGERADGISHEEVYTNGGDPQSRSEMLAWKGMNLTSGNYPFWIGTEDYVGACDAASKPAADAIYAQAGADGFSAYVTDASAMQVGPCYW